MKALVYFWKKHTVPGQFFKAVWHTFRTVLIIKACYGGIALSSEKLQFTGVNL